MKKREIYQSFFKNSEIRNVIPVNYIHFLKNKNDIDKLEIISLKFQEIFTNKYYKFCLYLKWYDKESVEKYPDWFYYIYTYYEYITKRYKLDFDSISRNKNIFFLLCYIGWNLKNLEKIKYNRKLYNVGKKYFKR